ALAGPLRTAADGTRCLLHPTNVTAALAARATGGLGLRARYPAFEGVGARVLERLIASALERCGAEMPELLPAAARARLALPSLAEALHAVHAPPDALDAAGLAALASGRSRAHRRLALEELLIVQAAFLVRRAEARAVPAPVTAVDAEALLARVQAALGFTLTASQQRAVRDIAADMGAPAPMQRLLLGDVGSGKTAVALAAAALAAAAGGQTLMMAPTETLAEQHGRTLGPLAA